MKFLRGGNAAPAKSNFGGGPQAIVQRRKKDCGANKQLIKRSALFELT